MRIPPRSRHLNRPLTPTLTRIPLTDQLNRVRLSISPRRAFSILNAYTIIPASRPVRPRDQQD